MDRDVNVNDKKINGNLNTQRIEKWSHVVKVAFGFIGIYILFSILFSMVGAMNFSTIVYGLTDYRDSTVLLATVFYFVVISLLFVILGASLSKRLSNNWFKRVIYVLPISLLGLGIWLSNFISTKAMSFEFGDWSWLGYYLYIYWAFPALEMLEHYLDNELLICLSAIPPIIPGLMFLFGIWVKPFINKREAKILLISIPCIFMFAILVSAAIPKETYFNKGTYPKVDGATAAIPFGQVLVQELTGATIPKSKELVNFNKSHGAYVNLIEKKADIIFVSGPSEDELALAEENNVTLKLTPIGRDAFIFLVHNENPVDNLTVEQLKAIYKGEIELWKEVGGHIDNITAYQRNENSGSQTFMEKQVMKGMAMEEPPKSQKIGGMGGLIETVAEYKNAKNAIGYSFYFFANEMHKNENIKFLSINGVPVNKETIISEEYPFTATLYAVTREGEPDNSPANQLLNWILSKEGSKAVEKGGFVPVNK